MMRWWINFLQRIFVFSPFWDRAVNVSRQFQSLYQRLDECLISDRFKLRQKLGNLSRRAEQGKPFDKLLADTEALITESEAAVTARAYDGQSITFPDLPVSSRRDEIAEAIQNNQVVVIAGETGSGKTTQLPKSVYSWAWVPKA